jgi:RNA polymerase sigma-70 factor (ECF subfamily)
VDSALALQAGRRYGAESDEDVLIQAAQTEPEALGELCHRYAPRLYGYFRARTGDDDTAQDLTQQVFVKAIDALPRYDYRGAPFGAWLFRIARNLLTDRHRRHRATVSWDLLPEPSSTGSGNVLETNVLEEETRARVRVVLRDLQTDQRELILLRFVAGLTLRQIAAVVGKSQSTVDRQIKRTLQTIQERYHADE